MKLVFVLNVIFDDKILDKMKITLKYDDTASYHIKWWILEDALTWVFCMPKGLWRKLMFHSLFISLLVNTSFHFYNFWTHLYIIWRFKKFHYFSKHYIPLFFSLITPLVSAPPILLFLFLVKVWKIDIIYKYHCVKSTISTLLFSPLVCLSVCLSFECNVLVFRKCA